MEVKVLVKSSSRAEPRTVDVTNDERGLSFFCDCPAGNWGRICKHKMALASGNDKMLFDEDQRDNFNRVRDWVVESGYPALLKELKEAEKELATAREKIQDIKTRITRAMAEGLK